VESASASRISFRNGCNDLAIPGGEPYGAPHCRGYAIAVASINGARYETVFAKVNVMADHVVPHFQNDPGVSVIEIGSREFMCVGATPPFDHPHVFLDLGNDDEIICPYCSTLYRFAADLKAGEARPPQCIVKDKVA
jgi:uncharacterized Zn-finger protein